MCVAGIASIEGLRRVRAVNAVQLDGAAVENAVFVGLRRFGKEKQARVSGVWVGSLGR